MAVVSVLVLVGAYVYRSEIAALGYGSLLDPFTIGELDAGAIIGFIIMFGAIELKDRPTSSRSWGMAIVGLSIVSLLVAGGGLYIGALFTLVGGVLAYVWRAPALSMTDAGSGTSPSGNWSSQTSVSPTPPTGGRGKFCPYCGSSNPGDARFCARCGSAFPQ